MKAAALYARVSSEKQKEEQTIGSQTEALKEYAQANGYMVVPEWIFQDEGYSGAVLVRPGLERGEGAARIGRALGILGLLVGVTGALAAFCAARGLR